MTRSIKNFGQNVEFQPSYIYRPASGEDVLTILNRHKGESIRAIGTLHAWSPVAESDGVILQMDHMVSIEIEQQAGEVFATVGAGCKIKKLIEFLNVKQLTLPSLGLIDEQTVSGATATGTHGSGKHSLSHYIESAQIAHYDSSTGEAKLTTVSDGTELRAARCSLGLLGIIVSLRFRCRKTYNIEEYAQLYDSLDPILEAEQAYPQQQFYLMPWSWSWLAHHRVETKSVRSDWALLYRAYCWGIIDVGLHVLLYALIKIFKSPKLIRLFYRKLVPLTLIRGWKVVDDSHEILTMEHELFRHIEIEIFVQKSRLKQATRFVTDVVCVFGAADPEFVDETKTRLEQIDRWQELQSARGCYVHHYPICCRRVLCDDTLISMACSGTAGEEDWYAISLISLQWPDERQGFYRFADFIGTTTAQLFNARCHWGKYNPLDRKTNNRLYPMLAEFIEIKKRFDPDGIFGNQWLDKVI
jgi:FAD/FMN-containing dehydrogenase